MFSLTPGNERTLPRKSFIPGKYSLRALSIIVVTAIVIMVLIWFGFKAKQKVIDIEAQWNSYSTESIRTLDTLNRIQANFGYGGFIHHFKNYVLRKDPSLLPEIEKSLKATQQAIRDYPREGMHKDEAKHLQQLNAVVDSYAEKVALAKKLVAAGKTSNYIDSLVKVDDKPALEAIENLSRHAVENNEIYKRKTRLGLEATLDFINRGILIIPLLLLIAALMLGFLRYITRMSAVLEESGEYLADLFESAPDATLIVDSRGNITEANQKAFTIFGYDKADLIGMNVENLMPSRYRDRHTEMRENSFRTVKSRDLRHDMDFLALTKEGKELPVEISLSFTRRKDENVALVSLRDISERKTAEEALHRNETMLKRAQQLTQMGSWDWDIKANKILWSDETYRIFAVKPGKQVTYEDFLKYIHPDDKEKVVNAVNEAVVYNKPYSVEHRIILDNGEERIISENGEVFRDDQGEAKNMVGVLQDVTEKKEVEFKLLLADNVFNFTAESIIVTDSEEKILRVNQAFTRSTGFSAEEAIGRTPGEILKSGRHDENFYQSFWKTLTEKGRWSGEIWDRRKDGSVFPARHNINAVKDEQGKVIQYISIFLDVTEQKRAQERIEYLAQFDQLTSLPNRALFNDRLQHAINRAARSGKKVGLLFIDLDGFKNVNDTFGHQAGDDLLIHVAHRLLKCVRKEDTVARLGGDEFTIILEELNNADGAAIVAQKVIKVLGEIINLSGNKVSIGASIGIALYPDNGAAIDALIKVSDAAMYLSKKNGKNQYHFQQ